MAGPNPNPGTDEEALRSDEKRGRSPEVEKVVDKYFGDDPDDNLAADAAVDRPGGR